LHRAFLELVVSLAVVEPEKPRQAAPGLEETKDQRAAMGVWALGTLLELQWPMGLLDSQGVVTPLCG